MCWPSSLNPVFYSDSSVILKLHWSFCFLQLFILFSLVNLLHFLTCPAIDITKPESPV